MIGVNLRFLGWTQKIRNAQSRVSFGAKELGHWAMKGDAENVMRLLQGGAVG